MAFRTAIAALALAVLGACAPQAQTRSEEASVSAHTNNHIDYVEFAAPDLNAVKTFYAAAFGWNFEDWGPDYAAFSGAGIEGGFRGGETPSAGGPLVILYAADLEASERAVVAAGGVVTERHDFPGGRRFHFRDPAGNVLGVWTTVQD